MNSRNGPLKKKQFGQNFLRSKPVAIASTMALGQKVSSAAILEIGCGDGFLTSHILKTTCKSLCVVEIDPQWAEFVKTNFKDPRLTVVCQDFLETDLQAILPDEQIIVIANLPYNIGFPILRKLAQEHRITDGVVMLQEEVALRLAAKPGDSDAGFVTMELGYGLDFKLLERVGPECFEPRPKVNSRLLQFERKINPIPLQNPTQFWKIMRAAFSAPRRKLSNNLANYDTSELDPAFLDKRAHQISLEQFIEQLTKLSF